MDFKAHNQCMTEAEKYQGALYVPPKGKKGKNNGQTPKKEDQPKEQPKKVEVKKDEAKKLDSKKDVKSSKTKDQKVNLSTVVPKNKNSSLYKVLKQLESDSKKSKKDLLKDLFVIQNEDGSIVLSLKQE